MPFGVSGRSGAADFAANFAADFWWFDSILDFVWGLPKTYKTWFLQIPAKIHRKSTGLFFWVQTSATRDQIYSVPTCPPLGGPNGPLAKPPNLTTK